MNIITRKWPIFNSASIVLRSTKRKRGSLRVIGGAGWNVLEKNNQTVWALLIVRCALIGVGHHAGNSVVYRVPAF